MTSAAKKAKLEFTEDDRSNVSRVFSASPS